MPTRALVLGGGGPVGIAWESGLIAGLEEMGVDLTDVTQRNMQLVVILPPHRIDALHQVDQRVADRCGRADADEKAVVHGSGLQDGRGQSAAFGGKSRG